MNRVAQRRFQSENQNPIFPFTFPLSLPRPTVNPLPDPHGSPKSRPDLAGPRSSNREDAAQSSYLPQKGFPEKSAVNGTDPPPAKAPPATSSYNRYVPKPYTSSARPFERKFESPKFNHNLLPNDAPPAADPEVAVAMAKPRSSPQPAELDSGMDAFSRTAENRPKCQYSSTNIVPQAIPVR